MIFSLSLYNLSISNLYIKFFCYLKMLHLSHLIWISYKIFIIFKLLFYRERKRMNVRVANFFHEYKMKNVMRKMKVLSQGAVSDIFMRGVVIFFGRIDHYNCLKKQVYYYLLFFLRSLINHSFICMNYKCVIAQKICLACLKMYMKISL